MAQRDPKRDKLKLAFADAFAMWQTLEMCIEYLFCTLLSTTDKRFASVVFHGIISFRTRLEIMGDLIELRVEHDILKKEWHKLERKLRDANNNRNKLAHWIFLGHEQMTPHVHDARARTKGKHAPFNEIREMERTFERLHSGVLEYKDRAEEALGKKKAGTQRAKGHN